MIIWSGHGYLVAVFAFVSSLLMELATESAFKDDTYYQTEAWPLASALVIAGVLSLLAGLKLRSSAGHTFFFIKVHLWGPILFAIAAIVFIQRTTAAA